MDDRRTLSFVIVITSLDPVRARVAATSGIKVITTPYHVPRANAICERFLGSVRRECLDHLFILHEKQLQRVLNAYVLYAQSGQTTSRDQTADSRVASQSGATRSRRWQGPLVPGFRWLAS